LLLVGKHGLKPESIESIVAYLPEAGARVINNRDMPDICLQHILAVALQDKKLTFEAAHSYERLSDPAILDIRKRIKLVEDPELTAAKVRFQGTVEVTTASGEKYREHVVSARGNAHNPMTSAELEDKCENLMSPVLGKTCAKKLIDTVFNIEQAGNMRELRPLLSRP
jgi:2-methylcitrate dehydratase PrpD